MLKRMVRSQHPMAAALPFAQDDDEAPFADRSKSSTTP